ncbi:MAG: hypothetical protein AB8G77_07410 [Rhodothermales bacterium]
MRSTEGETTDKFATALHLMDSLSSERLIRSRMQLLSIFAFFAALSIISKAMSNLS